MEMDYNEEELDQHLKSMKTEGGFTVPFGYFERLPMYVLRQTVGEKIENNDDPLDYFKASREAILSKTIGHSGKQLIVWYRKPMLQWVAALFIFSTAIVFRFYPSLTTTPNAHLLSDEDVFHYLEQTDNRDIADDELNNLNTESLLTESEQELIIETEDQLIIDEL